VQLALASLTMAALIVLTNSTSRAPSPALARARLHPPLNEAGKRRIGALFAGIPQHGAVLGYPGAPATLQFFGDLECKEARQFVLGALPVLVRKWVRGGELRIRYRANPEETVWPDIYNHQQVAALAAGRQGKLWQYLDVFYHEQGPEFTRYAIDHFLRAIAGEVGGLDFARWTADRHERGLTQQVKRDLRVARAHRIHYTPAFLVGPTGGVVKPLLNFTFAETAAFDEAVELVVHQAAFAGLTTTRSFASLEL
jgi:protein-disulfide isomerase